MEKQNDSLAVQSGALRHEAHAAGAVVSDGQVIASEDTPLFARGWTPRGRIKANVVLTHGMGEHSGRYFHVGEFLANNGYRFCCYDMRGHGRSPGARGHVKSYGVLLE